MIGIGIPARHNPLTLNLPPFKCISYHLGGCVNFKCGSFAKSGLPDLVLAPEITQLFEPETEELYPNKSSRNNSWFMISDNILFLKLAEAIVGWSSL